MIERLTLVILLLQRVSFATQLSDSCLCGRYCCAYHPRTLNSLENLSYSFVLGISFRRQLFQPLAMFQKSYIGDRVNLSARSMYIPNSPFIKTISTSKFPLKLFTCLAVHK